ncbi:uncharacterized protein LOC116265563 isoform X2 [Nymphaea colorata]|uniref:uncharacterized protein LOC116265563 isoform X2 n=1 Tax=Nymphaea colorata TaxID=210225 RepID=UPI00129DCB0A|nr:uncharacterized protein LOC116265563 isoform X2 [Nymphaea colorata]
MPGSARSGILGEAVINLVDHMTSKDPEPILVPLNKCNYGTVLQVSIQCLTPKARLRGRRHRSQQSSDADGFTAEYDDMHEYSQSEEISAGGFGTNSSKHLDGTSQHGSGRRDTSSLRVASTNSSSSRESSVVGTPSRDSLNGDMTSTTAFTTWQDLDDSRSSTSKAGFAERRRRSNSSSFGSSEMGSVANTESLGLNIMDQSSPQAHSASYTRTADHKAYLEASEATIKELQSESSMWERTAEKLKREVASLRKELSDQSELNQNLGVEVSEACVERDRLKLELNNLKASQASKEKNSFKDNSMIHEEDVQNQLMEMKQEIEYQKECNVNLALQLSKTQESNMDLISAIQELEETIEEQRLEIEKISTHDKDDDGIIPKLQDKKVSENDNLHIQLQELLQSQKEMKSVILSLQKDIDDKQKEIEYERNLKDQTVLNLDTEKQKLSAKEEQISELEAQVAGLLGNHPLQTTVSGENSELLEEIEALKAKVQELERDCSELTDENLELILKMKEVNKGMPGTIAEVEDNLALSQQPAKYELKGIAEGRDVNASNPGKVKQHGLKDEFLEVMSLVKKQLKASSELVNSQWYTLENSEIENRVDLLQGCILEDADLMEEAKGLFNQLHELNKDLEAKVLECSLKFSKVDSGTKQRGGANGSDTHQLLKDHETRIGDLVNSVKQLETMNMNLQHEIGELNKEQAACRCRVLDLETELSTKNEEMETLRLENQDLTTDIEKLKKEKDCLDESLKDVLRESGLASKFLDDARQDLRMLASSVDSHISARRSLENKSVELENVKEEVEAQLSELEEENIHLSERISGLEAQLRYLTEERESSRLAIENYKCQISDLQNERETIENNLGKEKAELELKLIETQTRFSEAQEAAELARRAQSRLQEKVECLEKDCESLQKLNTELRRQRLDLHDNCESLEGKFRAMQDKFSIFLENVELLEMKLDSIQNDVALRENSFSSEAEDLTMQSKELTEKLHQSEDLLNQLSLDMKVEIQSLQGEVECLKAQLSMTDDQRENQASNAVLQISQLQSERRRLECVLQEVHDKVKRCETELFTTRLQSETKVQELMGSLAASKQNEQSLKVDLEHMQKVLEDTRLSDGNSKKVANELELKLRSLEYDRQKLMEEIDGLSDQIQKAVHLKDENLSLRSSLDEVTFEKNRLEASLESISADYDELKSEKMVLTEKNLKMQKAITEGESAKRSREALEEKILRLEGDLAAKEALSTNESELRNEIIRFKRANSQFQRKVQLLEKEKDEAQKKISSLQKELSLKIEGPVWEEKGVLTGSTGEESYNQDDGVKDVGVFCEKIQIVEDDVDTLSKNGGTTMPCTSIDQSQLPPEKHNLDDHVDHEVECVKLHKGSAGCNDDALKIQILETELAEALEANKLYKVQLKSLLCEPSNICASTLEKLGTLGEMMKDLEDYKNKVTSLETELKDMRERYFNMSLSFAEVEAQREELVMIVRSLRNGS